MGLGDTIRGWLDPPGSARPSVPPRIETPGLDDKAGPDGREATVSGTTPAAPAPNGLDPAVRIWLSHELPRLEADGLLSTSQTAALARRYGVSPGRPSASPGAGPAAPSVATSRADRNAAGEPRPMPAPRMALGPFVSEHAVSIVLYLGAFLVVSAVLIFLLYAWELVGGGLKVAMVAGLTAAFLLAARLCLPRPSVRPAGRTFLALGAILVPANVAAAYTFLFADGPLPQPVYWLVGALLSGGLHAALSLRLESRAYGLLAALAPPVAAVALAALLGLDEAWWPTAASLALAASLVASRRREQSALADGARVAACVLLPLMVLLSLTALSTTGAERWSAPGALLVMTAALGWQATRPGRAWAAGPVAALILAPFIALAVLLAIERSGYLGGVAVASWLYAGVARRLPRRRAVLWDAAGALFAVLAPVLGWTDDLLSAGAFASVALLLATQARAHRTPLPLYLAALAVDLGYVKLLDVIGSPDSPGWLLGVALWPLALAWAAGAAFARRPWAWPLWVAALGTATVSALLTAERQSMSSGIAASYAVATVLAAWRLSHPPVIVLAVPWTLIAGWQAAGWLGLEQSARAAATGLAGWAFVGTALLRPPAGRASASGADDVVVSTTPSWAGCAWFGAAATTMVAALLASGDYRDTSTWRIYVGLAWLDLALLLAASARLGDARDVAAGAALALLPALLAGIGLAQPGDAQAYAIPAGLYLLGVASLIRRDRRAGRPTVASIVAGAGAGALVLTSFVQSVDTARLVYALLGLAEGLVLVALGIALRWRVVVVGGVLGVVLLAVRQLFDALAALPGWVILGGSGIALLGLAVMLLLVRDRLARTGRLVADRWAGWD